MRKTLHTLLALLLLTAGANAQAPAGINYQLVVRDGSGNVLSSRAVSIQFALRQGSAAGTIVFAENHAATTGSLGLVNLVLGNGTATTGTLAAVNWAAGPYFLETLIDQNGGSSYTSMGTQQLMSVPYALFSANAASAQNGVPAGGTSGQVLTNCNGAAVWTTGGICPGTITALNCGTATNNGTLTSGTSASGVSSSIPYNGGNGGTHSGQTVSSTGVTGLTATLAAGTFANGAGSLTYTITGTPASSGTASFALNIGGQTCTLSRTVNLPAGTITALNCGTATNNGTLTSGTSASGVSSSVPYTGGNGGTHSGQTVSSTGVTGLTATLAAGTFANGAGSLTYTISGTPASSGTVSFALNIGGQTCTLSRTVNLPAGTITALNCGTATNSGTLNSGTSASGVSSSIPYTGGNGGNHSGQTVSSTGVTGLTATLAAGTFANGAGSVTYTITGTPASSGTASFALNIGGQTCTLSRTVSAATPTYPSGTVHCSGTATAVVEVTNPGTGRIWMDRNLGASQAATSSTDANAYGDLYQWGRRADGHQCRNSATTSTLSSTDQPSHGNFILATNFPYDWRSPQNNNLWQGVSGTNNPCPSGYRIPTNAEWDAERSSWSSNNSAGAMASPLKLALAGGRSNVNALVIVGADGYYWSSAVDGASAGNLYFNSSDAYMGAGGRAGGFSVRCLKD